MLHLVWGGQSSFTVRVGMKPPRKPPKKEWGSPVPGKLTQLYGLAIITFVPFLGKALATRKGGTIMAEKRENERENPLDDLADKVSRDLAGETVDVNERAQDRVQGGQVRMRQSSARSVQASALHMEESAAAIVRAGSLDVDNSAIGIAVSRDASLEDVTNSLLIAQRVRAKEVRSVLMVAGRVEGNVRTLLTPLTGLAAGAGFAMALVAARFLMKKVRRS